MRKRSYQKSHKIFLYGGGSLAVFIAFLFGLSSYGVTPEISDRTIKCFGYNIFDSRDTTTDCVDYFNISLDSWHLCFNKDFDVYLNDTEGVALTVFKADKRYRSDNPARWKLYNFDTCLKNETKYEFKVELRTLNMKPLNRTIKYNLRAGVTDFDPAFSGIVDDDVFNQLIENRQDLTFGIGVYKLSNPSLFDFNLSLNALESEFYNYKGTEFNSKIVEWSYDNRDYAPLGSKVERYNIIVEKTTKTTTCNPYVKTTFANGSYEVDNNCTKTVSSLPIIEERTRVINQSYIFVPKESSIYIRLSASWNAMLGNYSKEWIPAVTIADKKYRQPKWTLWTDGWQTSRIINVTALCSSSTNVLENLTANYTTDTTANKGYQADCDDIRFATMDNTTLINYTFENSSSTIFGCNTAGTQIWINVSKINCDNTTRIREFFNNTGASAFSNPRLADGTATYSHALFGEVGGTNTYDTSMTHKWASGNGAGFTNVSIYGSSINCTAGQRWYETTTDVAWDIGGTESNYTAMVWFNHVKGADASNIWQIVMMRTPTYSVTPMRIEKSNVNDKLICTIGNGEIIANYTFVDNGNWTFIACERNRGTMRMYLGNTSGFFVENVASVTNDATMATPSELLFCVGNNDTTTQTYTGIIDDFRIINRKVTYDELYNIFKDGMMKLKNPTEQAPPEGITNIPPTITNKGISPASLNSSDTINASAVINFTTSTSGTVTFWWRKNTAFVTNNTVTSITNNTNITNLYNGTKAYLDNITVEIRPHTTNGGFGNFSNVTVTVNLANTTVKLNVTISILLDSKNANRSYELGTNVSIYANFSNSSGSLITTDSFCLDIDQNDYGTNYSCSTIGEIRYNYTNKYSAKNKFSNGYTNVTTGSLISCCNTLINFTDNVNGDNVIGDGVSAISQGSVWFLYNNQTNWIGDITFNISCGSSPLNVSFSLLETNNLYDIVGTEIKRVNLNLTNTYNCSEGFPDRVFNIRNLSINSSITFGKNIAIKVYVDNNNDGSPENVTTAARVGFSDAGTSGTRKYSTCGSNFTTCIDRYDSDISFYLGANLTQNASVEMYGGDELLNASLNISGTDAQNTILSISGAKIYEIPGWLQSNQTYQDRFTNNMTSETVTVDTAYTRYIRLLTNKSIVTANMTINGVQNEVLATNQTIDGSEDLYGSVGQNFTLASNTEISSFQFFVRDVGTQCCGNPQTNVSIKCGIINRTTGNVLVNSSIVLNTTFRGGPNNVFVTCPINRINLTSGGDYLLFFNQTGEPFQFYRVGKSSNIGDLYTLGVAFNFTTSFGVGGGWSYPGTPLTRDLNFKVFTTSLPENLTIDFGSNGVDDYNRTGVLNASFTLNISTSLVESFANSSKSYCNGLSVCNVPIKFKLGKGGTINVSSINFTYTGYNPIRIPVINWTQILNGSIPNNRINLTIVSKTENLANVTYSNLNITYKGSDIINITAHFDGNSTHSASNYSLVASIYYSAYKYLFPNNTYFLEFTPPTPTSVNVSAYTQSGAVPIFNITTRNYDKQMNFSVRMNESSNCINFTVSNTSTPSNGFQINTTFQNLWVNRSVNYSAGLWMWASYNCSKTGWDLFTFDLLFRGCCYNCLCDVGI